MCFPEVLYTIDVLFVAFVLLFAVVGCLRGVFSELLSLLMWVVLLGVIYFYYPALTDVAAQQWDTMPLIAIQGIVLGVLVLLALLLSVLLNKVLTKSLKSAGGARLNQIAGVLVGSLRGALIGLTLIAVLSLVPNENLQMRLSEQSVIAGWVCTNFTPWFGEKLNNTPDQALPETDVDPVQPEGDVDPVQPEVVAEQVQTEVVAETIQPEAVAEPVQPEVVAEQVQPEIVAEPVQPEVVAEQIQPEVITEQVQPEIVAEPVPPVPDLDDSLLNDLIDESTLVE